MVSTETAKAESSQAIFCYIADIIGATRVNREWTPFIDNITNNKYVNEKDFTYPVFQKKYKKHIDKAFSSTIVNVSPTFPKSIIHKFLHDGKKPNPIQNGWFLSALKIGKALIEDLKTLATGKGYSGIKILAAEIANPGVSGVSYVRGTPRVMGNIATLYKYANTHKSIFGDINKWNPADIYYATEKAKTDLDNKVEEENIKKIKFEELHKFIGDLMKSGDLLPLSLKKGVHKIKLKPVNFIRNKEEELLASTYCTGTIGKGLTGIKLDPKNSSKKFNFLGKRDPKQSRDIQIRLQIRLKGGATTNGTLKIRHTPASGGKPITGVKVELKYEKASARGGQLVGMDLFSKIVGRMDPVFGGKALSIFNTGYIKFLREMNRYKAAGGDELYFNTPKNSPEKKIFNDEVGAISAITIMNDLIKYIASYFSPTNCRKDSAIQHKVVRAIFEYVTSRSIQSSPFVIAKD